MLSKTASPSQRRRSVIKEFLANSTIDGLKNISEGHSLHGTLFWLFIFLLCLSLMFYFCILNIIEYFEYTSKTDLRFLSDYQSKFPAFTICNSDQLRSDRLQKPLIDYLYNHSLITTNNYSQMLSPTLFSETDTFLLTLLNNNGVSTEELIEMTYTLDIMLLNCTYNGKECNQSDFVWFYSYDYGSCYTFNVKNVNETTNNWRMTTENGGNGELDIQFYAHSQLYLGYLEGTSGIVALIHDNEQLPQIENQGLFLEPNRKHILHYTKSEIGYLGSPYTSCTTDILPDMSILFQKYGADYQYSQQICYTLCEQAFIYRQCNCTDSTIWTYNNVYIDNEIINTKLCPQVFSCVHQEKVKFNLNQSIQKQYCSHCLQECAITKYNVISSSVKAPTIWNYPLLKQQIEQQFQNVTMPLDWSSNYKMYIDQNYVAIQVIKSTYNVEDYKEQPKETIDQLTSAIGGNTVLWIGFSFIAIVEILELIYQLTCRSCDKQKQKTRVQPTVAVIVLQSRNKSTCNNNDLEDTQSIDEIVLVK